MRKSTGRIFQRGKSGFYYIQFYINRKQIVKRLLDSTGAPITSMKEAQKAAERIMHPVIASCKTEQLYQILEAVETAEIKAERAAKEMQVQQEKIEEEKKDAAGSISAGWSLFMSCRSRPESCKRGTPKKGTTVFNYITYYKKFSEWCEKQDTPITRLSEIDLSAAESFFDELRDKCSNGTINKYLQFLRCMFDCLIKDRKVSFSVNPFNGIEREKNIYRSKRPFTKIEVERIFSIAEGDLRLLCMIGLYTGLRFGDCCTLKWNEVDLENRIIQRIPRKTAGRLKDINSAIVKLGIPSELRDELLKASSTAGAEPYIMPKIARLYTSGRPGEITNKVQELLNKAGIQTTEARQKGYAAVLAGFHSFRYTYISRHAEAGTPAAVIQKNAGHSNPAMTEHYTRISDDAARKYAMALDKIAEPERDTLKKLADTLSIDVIRELLKKIKEMENKNVLKR